MKRKAPDSSVSDDSPPLKIPTLLKGRSTSVVLNAATAGQIWAMHTGGSHAHDNMEGRLVRSKSVTDMGESSSLGQFLKRTTSFSNYAHTFDGGKVPLADDESSSDNRTNSLSSTTMKSKSDSASLSDNGGDTISSGRGGGSAATTPFSEAAVTPLTPAPIADSKTPVPLPTSISTSDSGGAIKFQDGKDYDPLSPFDDSYPSAFDDLLTGGGLLFQDWKTTSQYNMLRVLGEGSYGKVVEAEERGTKKKVAIKRIENLFYALEDARRIIRELTILRQLKHPNIVEIVDVIIPDEANFNEIYIVFEMMSSDLLKLSKDTSQVISIQHVHRFLVQILRGMKHIHDAGVLHRDLKPANILLNEDCTLKLCDFGLARLVKDYVDPAEAAYSITTPLSSAPSSPKCRPTLPARQLTSHVVTRWYRAPELILMDTAYSYAVDMWSVGCILADLLFMMHDDTIRRVLFPGETCYPLSPGRAGREKDDFNDQLNKIFDVIGTPSKEEIEAVLKERKEQKQRLLALRERRVRPKKDLREIFPEATPTVLDLLGKMLLFDPKKRITVNEALSHDFIRSLDGGLQPDEVERPNVKMAFNENGNLTEQFLRKVFRAEATHYKKKQ